MNLGMIDPVSLKIWNLRMEDMGLPGGDLSCRRIGLFGLHVKIYTVQNIVSSEVRNEQRKALQAARQALRYPSPE